MVYINKGDTNMNLYLLTRSTQAGFYVCLISAIDEILAVKIAEKNNFSFRLGFDDIREINPRKTGEYINLIDFDDPMYEG